MNGSALVVDGPVVGDEMSLLRAVAPVAWANPSFRTLEASDAAWRICLHPGSSDLSQMCSTRGVRVYA